MVKVQVLTGDAKRAPHLAFDGPVAPVIDDAPRIDPGAQPIGVFAYPAGLLIIAGDEFASLRADMLRGHLPDRWPPELDGVAAAYAGQFDIATELLHDRARCSSDPMDWINVAVMDPGRVDLTVLRHQLPPAWRSYLDFVAAHEAETELGLDDACAPVEVRALTAAALAGAHAASGEIEAARAWIDTAVTHASAVGPALHAVMLSARTGLARDHELSDIDAQCADLGEALGLIADGDLRIARAEMHLALGQLLHERAALQGTSPADAAAQYQSALQTIESTEAPEIWAAAHSNLATVYLTMPVVQASDQLRMAVAVQSLRKALRIYTPDAYPQQWASTQTNLANALVYTPSSHQADNLVEAVQIYDEILAARDADDDPVGYCRVLANQGNVFAHLGMFDIAKARLYEARHLAEVCGEDAMVRAIRGVLDEIVRTRARSTADDDATGRGTGGIT